MAAARDVSVEPTPRRIGDRERSAAEERLRDAYAQGALTIDEFDERLTTALQAVYASDLEPLLADLPPPRDGPHPAPPVQAGHRPPSPRRPRRSRGSWGPPLTAAALVAVAAVGVTLWDVDAVSVFGSSRLVAEAGEEVRTLTLFGSTEVVLPDGVPAETGVVAVFGSSDCDEACRTVGDEGETVTVEGIALFGSVEILTESESVRDE